MKSPCGPINLGISTRISPDKLQEPLFAESERPFHTSCIQFADNDVISSVRREWTAEVTPSRGDRPLTSLLTQREREVLTWVAKGKTSLDVAEILRISARTVEQHIQNSAQKLGTNNRIHTVVSALQRGEIVL